MKKFSVKKGTLPLRWVSSPGPLDCRSNALSSELRRFYTTFLTESIYACKHQNVATPHSRAQPISITRKPNYGGISSEFTSPLVLKSDYWMSILLEYFLLLQKAHYFTLSLYIFLNNLKHTTYVKNAPCFQFYASNNSFK